MKKLFFSFFIPLSLYATAGKESEHFPAEFWQGSDGKFYIKIIELYEGKDIGHLWEIKEISHSKNCDCNLIHVKD